jgi:hypothetical protein
MPPRGRSNLYLSDVTQFFTPSLPPPYRDAQEVRHHLAEWAFGHSSHTVDAVALVFTGRIW